MEDFGFGSLATGAADFTIPDRILQLGRPPNRIDILTSISGVGFDECWVDRVPGELGGHTVNFLGWDTLIKNKIASGRDKDLTGTIDDPSKAAAQLRVELAKDAFQMLGVFVTAGKDEL